MKYLYMMFDHWDIQDLYKALTALGAGIVLGLERELKDKAAGLKTISLITLGSALFAIISYNIGQPNNEATRIASYIVSGIGFLGAGVIFKDGVNVSGLTTASVIWLASAIGMSIGFGQVALAFIFLCIALLLIYSGTWVTRFFPNGKVSRILMICMDKEKAPNKTEMIQAISLFASKSEERKLKMKDGKVYVYLDLTISTRKIKLLEDYLMTKTEILEFEM